MFNLKITTNHALSSRPRRMELIASIVWMLKDITDHLTGERTNLPFLAKAQDGTWLFKLEPISYTADNLTREWQNLPADTREIVTESIFIRLDTEDGDQAEAVRIAHNLLVTLGTEQKI